MGSDALTVPAWAFGLATTALIPIAGALLVLAFRSGSLVEGLKHIGRSITRHEEKLEATEAKLAEHDSRIRVIERTDELRHPAGGG